MDLVVLVIAFFIFFAVYKLLGKVADNDTVSPTVDSGDVEVELNIPEDSMLRRHFLSNLKSQVEAE